MATQNMKNALAFAAFSFLLLLIATFGVVYRCDYIYPGYRTVVQVALFQRANVSDSLKSENTSRSTTEGKDLSTAAPISISLTGNVQDGLKSTDPEKFDTVITMVASVKSRTPQNSPTAKLQSVRTPTNEVVKENGKVKFPNNGASQHPIGGDLTFLKIPKPLKSSSPEKLMTNNIPDKSSPTPKTSSFYNQLVEMVQRDVGTEQILPHNPRDSFPSQVLLPYYPPEESAEDSINPRTLPWFSSLFPSLETLMDDLEGELSDTFDSADFALDDFLSADAESLSNDATGSDSDEQEFFFGRNPRRLLLAEPLPGLVP